MFNNILFSGETIRLMPKKMPSDKPPHDSWVRLYEAANRLKGVGKVSAIAALLGESDQRVTNWVTRGVSWQGAFAAQEKIGCDAHWILTGKGSMISEWPFKSIDSSKVAKLDPEVLKMLEDALLFNAGLLKVDIRISTEPASGKFTDSQRRAA